MEILETSKKKEPQLARTADKEQIKKKSNQKDDNYLENLKAKIWHLNDNPLSTCAKWDRKLKGNPQEWPEKAKKKISQDLWPSCDMHMTMTAGNYKAYDWAVSLEKLPMLPSAQNNRKSSTIRKISCIAQS